MTQPVVIVISGPPGSGKTTLAAALAQQLHLPWVSRDTLKQGMAWPHGFASDEPTTQNITCNRAFLHCIDQLIGHGVSVIADAAFQHAVWSTLIPVWQQSAQVLLVHCHIAESLRLQRLHQRLVAEPHRQSVHADQAYLAQTTPHADFQYYQSSSAMLDISTAAPLTDLVQHTAAWITRQAG